MLTSGGVSRSVLRGYCLSCGAARRAPGGRAFLALERASIALLRLRRSTTRLGKEAWVRASLVRWVRVIIDADLVRGRLFEGALDLLGPFYYGAGERQGGVRGWLTGPVARYRLRGETVHAVGPAAEPAADDIGDHERKRDYGDEKR